jgi:superfamily II DNA or RNA helicase
MKRLAILGVALGLLAVPAQAQTQQQKQNTVEFNGMVFDAPPPEHYNPGYSRQYQYTAPRTAEPQWYQGQREYRGQYYRD